MRTWAERTTTHIISRRQEYGDFDTVNQSESKHRQLVAFDSDPVTRPLILFLVLMTAIFIVHLVGFRAALSIKSNARTVAIDRHLFCGFVARLGGQSDQGSASKGLDRGCGLPGFGRWSQALSDLAVAGFAGRVLAIGWIPSGRETGFVFAVVAVICLLPVALSTKRSVDRDAMPKVAGSAGIAAELEPADGFELLPPAPVGSLLETRSTTPTDGIAAFLSRWEMNDLVFLVMVENLRPTPQPPWFAVMPQSFRSGVSERIAAWQGTDPFQASCLLARAITTGMFLRVRLWLLYRMPPHDPIGFGRTAF